MPATRLSFRGDNVGGIDRMRADLRAQRRQIENYFTVVRIG